MHRNFSKGLHCCCCYCYCYRCVVPNPRLVGYAPESIILNNTNIVVNTEEDHEVVPQPEPQPARRQPQPEPQLEPHQINKERYNILKNDGYRVPGGPFSGAPLSTTQSRAAFLPDRNTPAQRPRGNNVSRIISDRGAFWEAEADRRLTQAKSKSHGPSAMRAMQTMQTMQTHQVAGAGVADAATKIMYRGQAHVLHRGKRGGRFILVDGCNVYLKHIKHIKQ